MQTRTMNADARCAGLANERAECSPSDEIPRDRARYVLFDHRRGTKHSGFEAELANGIHCIGPDRETGAYFAKFADLFKDDRGNADSLQGDCSGQTSDSAADDRYPHAHQFSPEGAPVRPYSRLRYTSYIPTMRRHVLIFGLIGGLLIATLRYTEYRFVIIEHSIELYGALVAILFAAFGIWLGLRITRSREIVRETVVVKEVLVPAEPAAREPFAPNTAHQQDLGITPREIEILTLIARGFSNREIATQLFVSENTVKTHCARVFNKLGAARRTQAVQRGKELGLLV